MKRLGMETIGRFLSEADVAAVMFGAPTGEATMNQAVEFAGAWRRCKEVSFGYVDAFEEVALARSLAIRVLPTTLVVRNGKIVERYEGRHSLLDLDS